MSSITEDGLLLQSRINQGKFLFTRAKFDVSHDIKIINLENDNGKLKLTLRTSNEGLNERVNYSSILIYAKIEGDESDVCYANIEKSSYLPSQNEMAEFVEDFVLYFTFSNTENVSVQITSSVFALQKDLEKKPDFFFQTEAPDCDFDYIWYRPLNSLDENTDDEIDDKEVILELCDEEKTLNVELDGATFGVENAIEDEEEPSTIIIE